MAWRIGIDIGGTFTDVALVEEVTGRIGITKILTTPHDFAQGVIEGIRRGLAKNAVDPVDVTLLSHATTVVTNALLEKQGAKAGFCRDQGVPRPLGATPILSGRSLRPVPGRA
jgi:N-methylhydantoinase A